LLLKSSETSTTRTVNNEVMMVTDSRVIKDVIGVLSAKDEFEGEQKNLNLRVGLFGNKWYYDFTNPLFILPYGGT
jgi:hypothetical protein